jgi:hypothetical protein
MFFPFSAQLVGLMDEIANSLPRYCPPKLLTQGAIWTTLSVLGMSQVLHSHPASNDLVPRLCNRDWHLNLLAGVPVRCGLAEVPAYRQHVGDDKGITEAFLLAVLPISFVMIRILR